MEFLGIILIVCMVVLAFIGFKLNTENHKLRLDIITLRQQLKVTSDRAKDVDNISAELDVVISTLEQLKKPTEGPGVLLEQPKADYVDKTVDFTK